MLHPMTRTDTYLIAYQFSKAQIALPRPCARRPRGAAERQSMISYDIVSYIRIQYSIKVCIYLSISLSLYIYIYIYVYMYMYIYIRAYFCIYIHTSIRSKVRRPLESGCLV